MRISCITTTYNDGGMLLTSIGSLLNQTHQDLQIILVNDGSKSPLPDAVRNLPEDRLLLIDQANDGLSAARNKALEHVTGEYVCFLDADDCRPNWAIKRIAEQLEKDQPDILYCAGILSETRMTLSPFYDQDRIEALEQLSGETAFAATTDETFQQARLIAQSLEPQSANKVIRSDFLRETGIGFPNGHFFEDIYFHTMTLALAERISVLNSPCFTYFRRYQAPQITSATGDMRFDIIPVTQLTLEMFEQQDGFTDPEYREAVLTACFRILMWCETETSHMLRAQFRDAVRGLLLLLNPLYLDTPATTALSKEVHQYIANL